MKVAVYIQGQRLDLFEDDEITVKQVAKDLKDISKIFSDYSQTFNVPASPNNNVILSNWFNADIDNGFDARTRVPATIEINTLDFKIGKIRLDGAEIKDNEPVLYKLTFFGNVIKIKDLVGEDELSDLDWLDNFDHTYSGAQVKTGLTTGLDFTVDSVTYDAAVIYPMISYKRQWKYNSDVTDVDDTDTLVNIASNGIVANHGVDSRNLKPAIKLNLIVKAIQEKYGLIFTSPFFDLGVWKEIYVNLNQSTESLATGISQVESVSGTASPTGQGLFYEYIMTVTPRAGFENVPYKIRLTVNGVVQHETNVFIQGTQTRGTGDEVPYTDDYTVLAEVLTEQSFEFDANTELRVYAYSGVTISQSTVFTNSYTSQAITLTTTITNELPDIKVYDFLTNIFKTFNLIATVDDDQNIYIQDLQRWYAEGEIYDVTKWIDLKSQKVNRGKIYKEINFVFEESEQILADEFEQSNNEGYGNLVFKLTDESGNDLQDVDGEVLEVESLFENPIHERLLDLDDNTQTTIQYTPYFNREIKPIAGGVFMFYGIPTTLTGNPINFINDGTKESITTQVIMPSHSYVIDQSTFNLNFNAEINEYTGIVMPSTIYKEYWEDYITDMFSVKRRIYNFEAILPDFFLNQLNLNDRLIIKDRRYIINSITSDLVNRKDRLELINDIYEAPLASDTLNTSVLFRSFADRRAFGLYPPNAQTYSLTYIGENNKNATTVDTGDGTSFITLNNSKTVGKITTIEFELTENTSGSNRNVRVQVTDGINDPVFNIFQHD